ncbi:MAG TPA: cyclodeaminase/cyclohydrolase family protein [Planctomycetota bacterium]|nr:cyclodeaminase/cyclohydrolase family protein [Planctomycetota bacterium]
MTLLDRSVRDILASTAAKTPTPGGGAIAALNGALGAALVAMAARFTSGKKYVEVEAEATRVADACDAIRAQLAELVDADCAAYDAVTAAYKLPKGTPTEEGARTQAIARALAGAMEVPRRTMKVALEGLALAERFARKANPNLASDVLVGAVCLHAAVEGARANVLINAKAAADPASVRGAVDESARDLALAGERLDAVRRAISPE